MTKGSIQPDSDNVMSGNRISVKASDLNQEFDVIKEQLENIVADYSMD